MYIALALRINNHTFLFNIYKTFLFRVQKYELC